MPETPASWQATFLVRSPGGPHGGAGGGGVGGRMGPELIRLRPQGRFVVMLLLLLP